MIYNYPKGTHYMLKYSYSSLKDTQILSSQLNQNIIKYISVHEFEKRLTYLI